MTATEYLGFMIAIYMSPRLNDIAGWILVVVCLVLQLLSLAIQFGFLKG